MRWLVFLSLVTAALAQVGPATISGRVLDQAEPVPGAPLEAKNIESGKIFRTTSSANGAYSTGDLPPGKYEVTISVGGFENQNVTVTAGQAVHLDFRFQPDFQLATLGDGDIYSRIARLVTRTPPTGPAPRTPDGKPDFSGVWNDPKTLNSTEPELRPSARQILDERFANNALDSPAVRCMPDAILRLTPFFKLVQSKTVLMVVIEAETPGYYQVFLDGRSHPKDPNPAWYGHAIGKWDGDTLVVDTVGFNPRRWLTIFGTPISEKLHIIERFRRPDTGHLELETTIEDPETYPRTWTLKRVAELAPDEEIMESICNENNKDPQHMIGK